MTLTRTLAPAPVDLQGVHKRFGRDVVAVDDVNLHVEPGSLVTLLGPSGCGKTTTLRMIAGLEPVSGGSISIDGEDVTRLPANLRDVTMVFQSYALFPHMNVRENVAYGLRVSRRPEAEVQQRVGEALTLVGLPDLGDRAPFELSGGQQQRVALARALVMQPRVLLFDEPLSNLDAKLRRRVRGEIRDLQKRLGITSIYVTHDQEEALAISDVIVVLNEGRVRQIGSPHDLYARPADHFVADFIGTASFLRGHWDGRTVTVGDHAFSHAREDLPPGEVTVMVRPEAVQLHDDTAQGITARVHSVSYLGSATEVLLDTSVGELLAIVTGHGRLELEAGNEVGATLRPAGVYLLPPAAPEGNPAR